MTAGRTVAPRGGELTTLGLTLLALLYFAFAAANDALFRGVTMAGGANPALLSLGPMVSAAVVVWAACGSARRLYLTTAVVLGLGCALLAGVSLWTGVAASLVEILLKMVGPFAAGAAVAVGVRAFESSVRARGVALLRSMGPLVAMITALVGRFTVDPFFYGAETQLFFRGVAGLGLLLALACAALNRGPAKAAMGPTMGQALALAVQDRTARAVLIAAAIVALAPPTIWATTGYGRFDADSALAGAILTVVIVLGAAVVSDRASRARPAAHGTVAAVLAGAAIPFLLIGVFSTSGSSSGLSLIIGHALCTATVVPGLMLAASRLESGRQASVLSVLWFGPVLAGLLGLGYVVAAIMMSAFGVESFSVDLAVQGGFTQGSTSTTTTSYMGLPVQFVIGLGEPAAAEKVQRSVAAIFAVSPAIAAFLFYRTATGPAAATAAPAATPGPHFCTECGAENRPAAKFCSKCGAPLAPPTASASVPVATAGAPAFAPYAAVLVAALAVGAGSWTIASGALDKGWTKGALWVAPDTAYPSMYRCETYACLEAEMAKGRAGPEAVRFAAAYSNSAGDMGPGYATQFWELGRVDVVEVLIPKYGMAGETRLMVVDKRRIADPFDDEQMLQALKAHPKTAGLWQAFPEAFPIADPGFVRQQRTADGGQRIVVKVVMVNGCRACDVVGEPLLNFDFGPDGAFKTMSVVENQSDAMWTNAANRRAQALQNAMAEEVAAAAQANQLRGELSAAPGAALPDWFPTAWAAGMTPVQVQLMIGRPARVKVENGVVTWIYPDGREVPFQDGKTLY